MKHLLLSGVCALATIFSVSNAMAGMKDGTLNVALQEPHSSLDEITQPSAEIQVMARAIFDRLMSFNAQTGEFEPSLAKSWKRVNPTTWEFKLRDDVKWHDGEPFTAEDVAHTINYASDPKVKFRLKSRYLIFKGAEAVDKTTVRITTKRPYAPMIPTLAVTVGIFPKHYHGAMENKRAFGAKPIGTGPYRAVSVDKNKGVVLEANPNYVQANNVRPKPSVKRVHFQPLPDEQTTVAKLLTGGIDVARMFSKDLVANLANNPKLSAKAVNSFRFYGINLDAADRTGSKAFADVRVRKAIAHAINREELRKAIIAGGSSVIEVNAPCMPKQIGCKVTNSPPEFNPAKAKALLAEAGYANGLNMEIWALRESKSVTESVVGYLRQVGIQATMRTAARPAFLKARAQGKWQAAMNIYGSGGIPDAARSMGFYFSKSPRDYAHSAKLRKLGGDAQATFDLAERNRLYEQAWNHNNEMVYVLPIASAPTMIVHSKDVNIPRDFSSNAYGLPLATASWKK